MTNPSTSHSREADFFDLRLPHFLTPEDEGRVGGVWEEAQQYVMELALRPAKRIRPKLLFVGAQFVEGSARRRDALVQFAAGLEILHSFLLVHDDVADRAELRRGGPTLHKLLARHGPGEDLAVVAGDHLFARAIELMMTSPADGAARASAFVLGVCRHTAIGQYLDLAMSHRPLGEVTPFEALRVARLKTANYSFAAPLQCGALLLGGGEGLVEALGRVGRYAGLAFQLRDDLLGIFGEDAIAGKSGAADLVEGKRTLPVIVAFRRASENERSLLEGVRGDPAPDRIARAREIIRETGAAALTQRLIDRYTAAARRTIATLSGSPDAARTLDRLLAQLASRCV